MALAENWHLRSRARECAATQTAFTNGQPIITAIFPDPESSGYLRKDFSLDGWKDRPADAEAPFSFWKTTFAATAGTEKPAAEKLSAEEILRRLIEEDEDHTENTRYILAVMLERQKLLRETDSQRTPHGIIRVYEHRKTGEVMIVKDPDIPLDQIQKVQEEVIILLENNGRVPEPELADDLAQTETAAGGESPAEAAGSESPESASSPEEPAEEQDEEDEPARQD